jgi:riboflavin kinase/FMN adenylyltransferase
MRIFGHTNGIEAAARGAVVTIGNFDGVHRGHAAVIGEAGRLALDIGAPHAVLTFEPHPRRFFRPGLAPFRLTPFRAKARRLAELGVAYMFNLRFDARLAGIEAEDFVHNVLVADLGARHVVAGPGFMFGRARRGDAEMLRRLAASEGFGFTQVEPVRHGAGHCSSTAIRELIGSGRVDEAATLLGRPWEMESRVRPGDRRGRALGVPTANMAVEGVLHPEPGVYAVRVGVREGGDIVWRDGAAYVGDRPTFGGDTLVLEAHLFDFDGDLYGRRLRVAFVKRVRADETFDGAEALAARMVADCQSARRILADAAQPMSHPPAA